MANPQLENGFLQLSLELLEAFARFNFTARQRAIVDVILRRTWGVAQRNPDKSYRRDPSGNILKLDSAWISLSEYSRLTGIAERHVCAILRSLIEHKIIARTFPTENRRPHYGLLKDYDQWSLPKRLCDPPVPATTSLDPHSPVDGSLPATGIPSHGNSSTPCMGVLSPTQGSTSLPPVGDIKQNNKESKEKRIEPTLPSFPKPKSDHQQAIDFWCSEYKSATGVGYAFAGAKEGAMIKRMLKSFGLADLQKLMLALINTDDPWLRDERGLTIATLSGEINNLAQKTLGVNHAVPRRRSSRGIAAPPGKYDEFCRQT